MKIIPVTFGIYGPDSSVGIVNDYGLDSVGIKSQVVLKTTQVTLTVYMIQLVTFNFELHNPK
jgi:hypothetical protein